MSRSECYSNPLLLQHALTAFLPHSQILDNSDGHCNIAQRNRV